MKKILIILSLFSTLSFAHAVFGQKKPPRVVTRKEIVGVTVKAAPEPEVSTKNLSDEQKLRLETFRAVWKIIDQYYFDRTFNGLNWQKLKYENELKVVALKTDDALYDLLNELVGKLNASHFAIVPPEYLKEIEKLKELSDKREKQNQAENSGDGEDETKDDAGEDSGEDEEFLKMLDEYNSRYGIGADVRLFDRDVVITHVDKNSAAEKAGLKAGQIIKTVNGISLAEFIGRLEKFEPFEKKLKKQVTVYIETILFNGDKDSELTLEYDGGDGKLKNVSIKREKLEGELIKVMSNMPRQFLQFERKDIDDETGYVRFNIFTVESAEKFCDAISYFKNKKQLVIDLRGNIGGSFGSLFGIMGLLIQDVTPLGTEISAERAEPRYIRPHLKNFKGKIAVLVDGSSMSAAEIISAGLQDNGRAVIVGETSGGEALPSILTELPNGAIFQYPVANFKSPKGIVLEGKGVSPDIAVMLDRKLLLEGRDNQLESALASFKNEKTIEKKVEKKENVIITGSAAKPPPPPPPPAPMPAGKIIKKAPEKDVYDAKAVEIIGKYIANIGGEENLKKLESLSASGDSFISRAGAKVAGTFSRVQRNTGKITDTYRFDGIGEISEIFDGEKFVVQTQLNGAMPVMIPVKINEMKLEKDFLELVNLKTNYSKVKFLGNFERLGSRVNLIELKNKNDYGFVLAFDEKTNLIVQRTGTATDVSYEDYRKVGEYLLPFKLSQANIVSVEIFSYKINEKIDDASFAQKASCFDRVD